MHCRPGHTKPVRRATESPSCPSPQRTGPFLSSRSANVRVNLSGMCCATTSAPVPRRRDLPENLEQRARAARRARDRHDVLRREVLLRRRRRMPSTCGRPSAVNAPLMPRARDDTGGANVGRRLRTRSTLARICSRTRPRRARSARSGLATKSSAPSSSALKTFSFCEYDDTTMTGVGCLPIRMRRKVKPSIRGISRSSVMTSGLSSVTRRSASSPSPALPTTSTSGGAREHVGDVPAVVRRVVDDEEPDGRRGRHEALLPTATLFGSSPRTSLGLAVDEVFLQVDELEGGRHVEQRLGVAEQEDAARVQALVEDVDDALPLSASK